MKIESWSSYGIVSNMVGLELYEMEEGWNLGLFLFLDDGGAFKPLGNRSKCLTLLSNIGCNSINSGVERGIDICTLLGYQVFPEVSVIGANGEMMDDYIIPNLPKYH